MFKQFSSRLKSDEIYRCLSEKKEHISHIIKTHYANHFKREPTTEWYRLIRLNRQFLHPIIHYTEITSDSTLIATHIENCETWYNGEYKDMFFKYQDYSKEHKEKGSWDSGLVGLTSLERNNNGKDTIHCYFSPYCCMEHVKLWNDNREKYHARPMHCDEKTITFRPQTSIGLGLVLSIIAMRGSSLRKDATPHLILIIRSNEKIRSDELDVAVVEGINCSDFIKNNF